MKKLLTIEEQLVLNISEKYLENKDKKLNKG